MATADTLEHRIDTTPEQQEQAPEIARKTFAVDAHRSTTHHKVHALVPTTGDRTIVNTVDYITTERDPVVQTYKDAKGKMQPVTLGTRIWIKAVVASFNAPDSRFTRHVSVPAGEDVDTVVSELYAELEEAIRNQA